MPGYGSSDVEANWHKLRELLQLAHDKMDEFNNQNPLGFPGCLFCGLDGYDGNGLLHTDDCILVQIRKELS